MVVFAAGWCPSKSCCNFDWFGVLVGFLQTFADGGYLFGPKELVLNLSPGLSPALRFKSGRAWKDLMTRIAYAGRALHV